MRTRRGSASASRLTDIEAGLVDLVRVIDEYRIHSIAMPALGAGNGGLAWGAVERLIEAELGGLHGVRVVLYPPLA